MSAPDDLDLSWAEMSASADRTAVVSIVAGKTRSARTGRGLALAKAFQAADVTLPVTADRIAAAFIRAAPVHAASHVLWLLWGYSIRPLAVIALEFRADVRAMILKEPGRVIGYAGDHLGDELTEAISLCLVIGNRLACEESLR